MSKLTIVAHITAKPDQIDLVRSELEKLIETTRAEEGCQQYDLHVDNDQPGHFLFYENWESRELWQQHMASAHLAEFGVATEGLIVSRDIFEMTRSV